MVDKADGDRWADTQTRVTGDASVSAPQCRLLFSLVLGSNDFDALLPGLPVLA